KVDKDCKVLTVHGSEDEVILAEAALECAKIIPNHKLKIIEGANHGYDKHKEELASAVLAFIKDNMHRGRRGTTGKRLIRKSEKRWKTVVSCNRGKYIGTREYEHA
nr:alpha/beta hydrolase fold protein [Tanacetum cinerariifolium]